MYATCDPTWTSDGEMSPSWFESANVYGRKNHPLAGSPTESRVAVVPIVGLGLPLASTPSERILLVLCEPVSVMSQPSARRSSRRALIDTSTPEFCTDPRLRVTVVADGAAEPAIGCAIKASCVFLL